MNRLDSEYSAAIAAACDSDRMRQLRAAHRAACKRRAVERMFQPYETGAHQPLECASLATVRIDNRNARRLVLTCA